MTDGKSSTGKVFFIIAGAILAVFGISYLIGRNKKQEGRQNICFNLPTSIDAEVFGPEYWQAFHSLAAKVPCGICRGFAQKFMVFFHDVVNLKTGKPLYDEANFNMFTKLIADIKANGNKWPSKEQTDAALEELTH